MRADACHINSVLFASELYFGGNFRLPLNFRVRSIAKLLSEHNTRSNGEGEDNFLSQESYIQMLSFINDINEKIYRKHGIAIADEVERFVSLLIID